MPDLENFTNAQVSYLTATTYQPLQEHSRRRREFDPTWNRQREPLDLRDVLEVRIAGFLLSHPCVITRDVVGLCETLVDRFESPHPLSDLRFLSSPFDTLQNMGVSPVEIDYDRLQHIANCIVRDDDGKPMEWLIGADVGRADGRYTDPNFLDITLDPTLHPVQPVLGRQGIPVIDVAHYGAESPDETARRFGVTSQQVAACVKFNRDLEWSRLMRRSYYDYRHGINVAHAIEDRHVLDRSIEMALEKSGLKLVETDGMNDSDTTNVEVPNELMPEVRRLLAEHSLRQDDP